MQNTTNLKTKQILTDKAKVTDGLLKTVAAIASTMGAGGKTVGIFDSTNELRFTKDGVSVAKSINLEDPFENIGAQLVINSANKTVEQCGDGTTLTSVLLRYLVDNKPDLKDLERVIARLKDMSNEVTEVEELRNIAKVSSNSETLGNFLGDIYKEVGMDALISLEFSDLPKTTYEVIKGVRFGSGYLSSNFATEPNGYCIFEDALIAIDKNKTSNFDTYRNLVEKAAKQQAPLVIISPDYSVDVKRFVMANVQKGLPICLIKAPGFGKQVDENFKDIRALLDEDSMVDRIVIKPNEFIIYNEDTPFLKERLKEVQAQQTGFVEDFDKMRLEERLHSLKGTSALIWAGGVTEKNTREEYDRIEDALGATQSALRSGYVKGGGIALLEATDGTSLELLGKEPNKVILENAHKEEFLTKEFNVKTGQVEDFLKSGIIDPTEVIINALRNAVASYELLTSTDYIIYNENKSFNPLLQR